VKEDAIAAIVRFDEAKTFVVVVHFDFALGHLLPFG
jgi:hypothetical protein